MSMQLSLNERRTIYEASLGSPTISLLSEFYLSDPGYESRSLKLIQNLPIREAWKSLLRSHISIPFACRVYEVKSPNIFIYNHANGESRTFLVTDEGFLLEPQWQSIWDKYFPFLHFAGNSYASSHSNIKSFSEISLPNQAFVHFPFQINYTHFLYDSLAPALALKTVRSAIFERNTCLSFLSKPPLPWQKDFLCASGLSHLPRTYTNMPGIIRVKLDRIVVPTVPNHFVALKYLRSHVFCLATSTQDRQKLKLNRLVFLSRTDSRRSRIRNIHDIEIFVASLGGITIDPSRLSISAKRSLLAEAKVCIAESSGCINYALFSGQGCCLVSLVEPMLLVNQEFLEGGWSYTSSYASPRVEYIIGEHSHPLSGSPVGSAHYSISKISSAVSRFLKA